ncbi:hypothetical protein BVI1335_920012 [Burkholderia vietnamiensis]|nr:hypothetical protein BVI1335_920012 [Burkholderia vietnamiensis]
MRGRVDTTSSTANLLRITYQSRLPAAYADTRGVVNSGNP